MNKFAEYLFRKYGYSGDPLGLMFALAEYRAAQIVQHEEELMFAQSD